MKRQLKPTKIHTTAVKLPIGSHTLLTIDPEKGLWTWGSLPAMVIMTQSLHNFLLELKLLTSTKTAMLIMYRVGSREGSANYRYYRDSIPTSDALDLDILGLLPTDWTLSGWGVNEALIDEETNSVTWVFPDGTCLASAIKPLEKSSETKCAYFAGLISGAVSQALHKTVHIEEKECYAAGGDRCLFQNRFTSNTSD